MIIPSRSKSFRQPAIFRPFGQLIAAESTRHGGVSPSPYASLNLGTYTDDEPENVAENRRRFFDALGISEAQLASSHQVHGREVLLAEEAGHYEGYDALISRQRGLYLAVTTADCTPILIYDPQQEAIAAIHAGWRGSSQEVAKAAVRAMQEQFGTDPKDCYAYIGTCIDIDNYEVDEKVAAQFDSAHKKKGRAPGKWQLSLKSANRAQLLDIGIPDSQVETSPYSTYTHNEDYFSHRKENGTTGRMLAVIGLTK